MEPWTFVWLMSLTAIVASLVRVQNRWIECQKSTTRDEDLPPTPHLIAAWKKQIRRCTPGSDDYRSYQKQLVAAGLTQYGD